MTATVEAIYENGVFTPVRPLKGLKERSRVTVQVVEQLVSPHPLDACIGVVSDADADEMSRIVEAEFEKVDPREWK